MKAFLVRGVPTSMQMDGWWLNSRGADRRPKTPERKGSSSMLWRAGTLIALLVLGDILIWQVARPGVSLALFGMAILGAAWFLANRQGSLGLVAGLVFFLPVIERVQAISVMFWVLGLLLGGGLVGMARWPGLGGWITSAFRLVLLMPGMIVFDMCHNRSAFAISHKAHMRAMLRDWILPVGVGFLFCALLTQANPMIEKWFQTVTQFSWLTGFSLARVFFWIGTACLTWPFLRLSTVKHRLAIGFSHSVHPLPSTIFNATSVKRSLVLFNLVFAVQTMTDLAFLWGGAALPEGMSFAEYAHRGAYPLLMTALLAGAFALASRPFTTGNTALKLILMAWVVQCVLLVISSMVRLSYYVESYGLTHLRLAAAIWMLVVAVGLCLLIWQILRDRSACWLLLRAGALGVATLYVASFHSFAASVAAYNLAHFPVPDAYYICYLDRAALPIIQAYEAENGVTLCYSPRPSAPAFNDWREWGFRDWRTMASLEKNSTVGDATWPAF